MQKKPFVTKEKLEQINRAFPTPYHLYDEAGIRRTARSLLAAFSWHENYREHYAVKACPNPFILEILKEEGCGVDCASMAELKLAHACGFEGEQIMFSSNETPAEEYEYARTLGAIINLDDITHIPFLAEHGGIPKRICLRYNPGGAFHVSPTCMGEPGTSKYGMTREQIFEAVRQLRALGAEEFALHAFLASNALDNAYYAANARVLFELAADVHRELGVPFFMVNLSGGVGIPYRPDEAMPDIALIGREVERTFEEVMVPAGLWDTRISTELGRFMTGPHGLLITKAVHEKHIYKEYIGVDACAANLMRPAMYGAYHHITVMGKEDAPCDHMYDVVGSLCENNDKFAIDRMLPKIDMGDILAIHDTGAHGFAMGYNYNGRLRSAEVLLNEDGSFRLIRRAETLSDYFATLCFDPEDPLCAALSHAAD
ncbi:MAG: diaminopimelate decarboxylase [Clostridiales bacterium]|nr:diaminopimelate decarboxylase [Clostridiales bacterium]